MNKIGFLLLVGVSCLHAQVFTLVDSIQYSQAQIWGVLSDDGDSLATTTTFTPGSKPHIYLRKVNYTNISQQSNPIQLTFDSDFTSIPNQTDHKSIVFNNELYIVFSTQGDQDAYIFKTDLNGNRIGSIVPVVTSSTDPTNDMILVTDSNYIHVLHFDPPNQSHVYTFDTNLNPVGSPFSTTTLAHNNIGNAIFHNNEFYMCSGDIFGFNSDLVLTRWTSAWAPAIGSPQTLINSSSGDGNWFSTGLIWDEGNQRWYIGMNHISSLEIISQEHIDLLAFDVNFNLIERIHTTGQGYFRPHFVLKNGALYVSYDKAGTGVWLLKYQLENTIGIEESTNNPFHIYPNPAGDWIHISFENSAQPEEWVLSDTHGKILKKIAISPGENNTMIDLEGYASGVYFLKSGKGWAKILKR